LRVTKQARKAGVRMGKHRGKGEGTVFQRQDGRWEASFYLENGKRKSFYGRTQKEALQKLRAAQLEEKQGMLTTGSKQALKHYLEHWLENVHKPKIRISTYVGYRLMLDKHIIPELGNTAVQRLTPQQVEALYAHKLKEGLTPGSVRNIHTVLHKALSHAVRTNLIARNVCDAVEVPRFKRSEMKPLTKEQAQLLLETAKEHRLETLLLVAITTGMRRGELLGLKWQDIDFDERSLQVRRTVSLISRYGYVENEPKTSRGRRKITLPEVLVESLKQHRTRQLEARLKAGTPWQDRNLVFCNTHGDYIDPNYLLYMFDKLLDKAGLPHMRFHNLRHSAATFLLVMGVHVKIVQELLGHSSISMTLDTYSHVLPGLQKEAMDKWNDWFGDGDGNKKEDKETS
jgi:integrase